MAVIDIGARGGIEEQWLQFLPHIAIYGFEPDPAECERLNREVGSSGVTYLPFAVGSTVGEKPFYVTKDPFCSSLSRPIEQLVRERPRLAEMVVKEVTSLHTRTIDDWTDECGLDRLDHLKIDAQGAELAILQGATKSLETARSVKLEVQFTQLYEDTPLFGQVDSFLRERGFVLWRFGGLSHCGFEDASSGVEVPEIFDYDSRRVEMAVGGGQLLWADAFYVRREATMLDEHLAWEDALRDACLANAHNYADLAAVSLRRALPEAPEEAQAAIRAVFSDPLAFGARWEDPMKHMQAVVEELKRVADERLAIINELQDAANERLGVIRELEKIAAERLRALEETTAALRACRTERAS